MSWFPSSNIASLAKNALKEAQKTIDKALDIKDDEGGHGVNTTVSSVADAASDFFNSWGVSVGSKPSLSKSIEKNMTNEPSSAVVTTAPTATKIDKSPTTSSLPNGASDGDIALVPPMKRSLTATDVSCELVAPNDDVPNFVEEERGSNKFQSLWLDGSDSLESSIETSSASIIEVLDDSNWTNDIGITILHPKPLHVQVPVQSTTNLGVTTDEEQSILIASSSISVPMDFDLQLKAQDMADEEAPDSQTVPLEFPMEEDSQRSSSFEQEHSIALIELEYDGGDLDSSTATTVEPEPDSDADEIEVTPNPPLPSSSCPERLDCDIEADHTSSKVSLSSRATSSISVISEEKDPSSPQISPSSQHHLPDSEDSPSFEVISIHHRHVYRKSDPTSNFDFLVSSSQHCPSHTSSVSVIPSLQSTPDRGTPLTHSRSNSNTSSSFDKIDDSNMRPKCPHHFISSTSSSDIEVIPLDSVSVESFNLYQRKKKSLAEMETQTSDPWPEKIPEAKERVVEMVPTKISATLAEKDFEILQLRQEGEKLSKKQFELGTAIKKLRQKEKDTDITVKSLKNDLAAKNVEIERLTKTFIVKQVQDQMQSETIGKLNSENRKLLNTVAQLRSELEDAKENASSMKASVEDASVEILELQNAISSVQRDTAELDNLTRLNGDLTNRSEVLRKEVEQLRHSINSSQLKSSSRESDLKTQILNLTHKVHSLENELSNNCSDIADATMPLSLEIEKLQQDLKSKAQTFDRREVHLLNKVAELESKVKSQVETEKLFKSSQSLLQNSMEILEQQNENLKDEKSSISYQLATEVSLRNEYFQKLTILSAQEDKVKVFAAEVSSLEKENEELKAELKNERISLLTETKRTQFLSEQLKLSNSQSMERVSVSSIPGTKLEESRNTSPRSIMSEASYLDDVLDPNGQNRCMTPKSFFDSFSTVNYIENLQGHLRQKELELIQLHDQVSKTEKIRKTLNEEIAHLTVNNQELLQRIERLGGLQQRLVEMDTNYNAVLQMYGEKVEEADELRMDLQDVKEMYKTQIEQLLKKS